MSKCNYCAFFSRACRAPDWDAYADGILAEVDKFADILGGAEIPTIFFGGGTPSLMPVKIFAKIIERINSKFKLNTNAEITLESNPRTLNGNKLNDFIAAGVNRLSVGVQALDARRLEFLGRRHSVDDAIQLLNSAMSQSIRVSGDFIYGIPGDGTEYVVNLCKKINDLGLSHCSLYELTIEPGTPLAKMNPVMPSNEQMADMYDAIARTLKLPRYEVSNYAAPGDECRHNQNVWDGGAYLGLGDGAAGRPFIDGTWYEQLGGGKKMQKMDSQSRAIEKIITGMRTRCGVKLTPDVTRAMDMDFVRENPDMFLCSDERLCVTGHGMLILDDLLIKLIR